MRRLIKTSSMSLLLSLILAFTFTALQAQNSDSLRMQKQKGKMLLGKVINAETGQAVANAKVTAKIKGNNNNSAKEMHQAMTDKEGLFMMTGVTKGNYIINVQQAGYQSWKNIVHVPHLTKKNSQRPFNGFFRPNSNSKGWLHGVFHSNKNNKNQGNIYAKSLFLTIGLQKK
jgi:hypothetical protein